MPRTCSKAFSAAWLRRMGKGLMGRFNWDAIDESVNNQNVTTSAHLSTPAILGTPVRHGIPAPRPLLVGN